MSQYRKRVGEFPTRGRVRKALMVGAGVAGAAFLTLAPTLVPAGAQTIVTNAPTANSEIVGAGSGTTYYMMAALDPLFNLAPGCNITSTSVPGAPTKTSQQLNFACETSTGATGAPVSGTTLLQIDTSNSYLDNPFNDVAVSEPQEGSSNGIAQLENSQAGGTGTALTTQNVSAINYARSSRVAKTSDLQGLDFVAYAKDAVTWFHFTKTTANTPSSKISNLTAQQLAEVWQGSVYDWGQLGATKTAPIVVFSAQEGSGTQSTWQTFLDNTIGGGSSFDPTSASNPVNCVDPIAAGTTTSKATFPASTTLTGCVGPIGSFENIATTMLTTQTSQVPSNLGGNTPAQNGIFFYSFGKYSAQCAGVKTKTTYFDKSPGPVTSVKANQDCGGTTLPTGYKTQLGEINGVPANPQTILATSGTVFPDDRFVFNVYSNGSDTTHPSQTATPATLNYMSEVGFLCKPQTANGAAETTLPANTFTQDTNANDIADPATGLWYHDEIYNTILSQGFIPLTAVAGGPTVGALVDGPPGSEGGGDGYTMLNSSPAGQAYLNVNESAYNSVHATDNFPTTNTSIESQANPVGYCLWSSTNGTGTQ